MSDEISVFTFMSNVDHQVSVRESVDCLIFCIPVEKLLWSTVLLLDDKVLVVHSKVSSTSHL